MKIELDKILGSSKARAFAVTLAATAVIGVMDLLSGPGFRFTFLYSFSTIAAVFYAGTLQGIAVVTLSTAIRLATDVAAFGSLRLSFVWNAAAQFGTYLILVHLVGRTMRSRNAEREREALNAKIAALERSVRERDLVVREVHHRVKNNLATLASLLNIQDRSGDEGTTAAVLGKIETFHLLYEKLTYAENRDNPRLELREYLEDLCRLIADGVLPAGVSLGVAGDRFIVPAKTAVYIGLVVNELVANSVEHAFAEGSGTIRVEIRAEGNSLALRYHDDGPGFDIDMPSEEGHIGKLLVDTFVGQLGAKLRYSRDQGSSYELTLRI